MADIKKVLLVDDNEDFCLLFGEYLELLAKDSLSLVGIAANGLEALKCIELEQPDIVVLDVLMPMLNGFGVLSQLRRLNMQKTPKVFMLSALDNDDDMQEAMALGAVGYLTKPFNVKALISQLQQI